MRRVLKFIVPGLVGLFALIGLASTFSSKPSSQPAPQAAAHVSQPDIDATVTARVNATVAAMPKPATPAPAPPTARPTTPPTAAPTVAPTAAPLAMAQVGDRVESAGIALTVSNATRKASVNQFLKPKPGNTYLVLDATVENTNRDKAPYNPLYFTVKDANGFEYDASLVSDDKGLKSGDLVKGDKARGTVAFEIPSDATGLVVSYEPAVLFGGYQTIKFNLDS